MKKLTITISEEMFRHIETLGTLFPWLTVDAPDYGNLIEERTSWLFQEQAEDSDQLETEIENVWYESRESVEAMLARYNDYAEVESEHRIYEKDGNWRIKFFTPDSFYLRLWDICAEHDLDYDELELRMFSYGSRPMTETEFEKLISALNLSEKQELLARIESTQAGEAA